MRASQFFIKTLKEAPADAEIPSQIYSARAGLIKKLAAGVFTFMPMGMRVMRKISAIIREEMDAASLSVGAGMGTSGLVGPLNFLGASNYSWQMVLCVIFVCVVAPIILVFFIDWLFRHFHLIEKGDFSLSNDLN